jgi:hypothetical protein
MKTTNIDIAAYLYLNGFRPDHVEFNPQRKREFTFTRREGLGDAIRAFDAGVTVPLNKFLEARVTMKDWLVDANARGGHYRALANVRSQVFRRAG